MNCASLRKALRWPEPEPPRRLGHTVPGRRTGHPRRVVASHEKIGGFRHSLTPLQDNRTMEAERINLIGNTLNDLAERTRELRGYL